MAKANSFKAEPWTGLQKLSWSIFDDDFINDKITFKLNKKSQTSGVQFKDNFALDKDSKVDKYSDQVKVWFPHKGNTFYMRLKNNAWKLHIDHGLHQKHGTIYNLYGSVQGGKELGAENIKLGLQTSRNQWVCNVRAAFKPSTHGVTLYHKLSHQKNNWRWWAVNAVNPVEKAWVHSALQIARVEGCCAYYFRANAGKKWAAIKPASWAKDILSDVTADYIWNYNDNTKLGLQVQLNQLRLVATSQVVNGTTSQQFGTTNVPNLKTQAQRQKLTLTVTSQYQQKTTSKATATTSSAQMQVISAIQTDLHMVLNCSQTSDSHSNVQKQSKIIQKHIIFKQIMEAQPRNHQKKISTISTAQKTQYLLRHIIASICLNEPQQIPPHITQLKNIIIPQISPAQIFNLQLIQKLNFIKQELNNEQDITTIIESKLRQFMEIIMKELKDTSRYQEMYQKQ